MELQDNIALVPDMPKSMVPEDPVPILPNAITPVTFNEDVPVNDKLPSPVASPTSNDLQACPLVLTVTVKNLPIITSSADVGTPISQVAGSFHGPACTAVICA